MIATGSTSSIVVVYFSMIFSPRFRVNTEALTTNRQRQTVAHIMDYSSLPPEVHQKLADLELELEEGKSHTYLTQ